MRLVIDGATVSANTGGRELHPERPLLLFLHGAALDKTIWQLQTRYFSHHGFSVMAVDLPGHGTSEGSPLSSIEGYADWVAALVEATGFRQAHLVGHSMGSLIALETAARHPAVVASLAMTGGAAAIPVHPALLAAAEAGDHLAYELMTSWGHGKDYHLGGHQTPGIWMLGATLRLWERAPPGVLAADLRACNDYIRGAEAVTEVRCPSLLISGSLDIMTVRKAVATLRSVADLQDVTVQGAGHNVMVEQPDAVIDAIATFLSAMRSEIVR